MKINKHILTTIIIIGLFISTASNVIAASDPTFEVDPKEPEQLSTVTITASFESYDDIEEINFLFNECTKDNICFTRQNVTMTNSDDGEWKVTIKLEHDDSAYVQYWLNIKTIDGWYEFPEESPYPKTYLKEKVTNGGSNGNANGQGNNDTPGFEIIIMIISIMSIIAIFKMKKRY